jgi:hypothetical protein
MCSRCLLFALVTIITSTVCRAEEYPLIHFCYARITLADTTLTGYFLAPYEGPHIALFQRFKREAGFFKDRIMVDIPAKWNRDDIEIFEFVYTHDFKSPYGLARALYRSAAKQDIKLGDILSLELIRTVDCHTFEPDLVESKILPADTAWMKQPVVATIDDPHPDSCHPHRYLAYDKRVDYKKLIQAVRQEKDSKKQRELVEALREYKIMSLTMSTCL